MNAGRRSGRGRRRVALGLLVVAAVAPALQASPALAYNGTEHIRHSDQAYQLLNVMRRGAAYAVEAQRLDPAGALAGKYRPLTQCPESVCPASTCAKGACAAGRRWSRFIAQAVAAPAKLDQVRTDLPDAPTLLVNGSCGGELPRLAPGELAQCRIGELSFAPRTGWGTNPHECFLRQGYITGGSDQNPADTEQHQSGPVLPFFQDLQSNLSGAAIGFWSTGPDGATEDTTLWSRPSSVAFMGAVREVVQDLGQAALTAGFVVVAPVACLADLFFRHSNCFSDFREVAQDVRSQGDELWALAELKTLGQISLPNVGNLPLPGMWHFGTVDREGQFNKVPGLKLIEGGPDGEIDELDEVTIVAADFVAATIQTERSQGVRRYAAFADGERRTLGDWLDPTVGRVEFEPVQNLAQWGWTQFRTGTLNAKGLGWVLHAIGDAAQPHHTISAIGWGHPEWERFANLSWEENFHEEDVVKHHPDLEAIVADAFRWWSFLDDRQALAGSTGSTDLAVRDLVIALLTETAHLPVSVRGRAYRRGVSEVTGTQADGTIRGLYANETESMKDLMARAIGASMAFLVKASDFVQAAGPSPCDCGAGASRFAQDASGTIVTAHDGLCHACGTGAFAGMPSWADGACVAACPPDKPTAQAGRCVATGACPATAPFSEGGSCVGRCSEGKVVVNNRSCEAACPAPQRADAAGFCRSLPAVQARMCLDASQDIERACCSPVGATAATRAECCSQERGAGGLCRGNAGDRCVVDDDCVTFACLGHRCATSPDGGPCAEARDCASRLCGEGHECFQEGFSEE